MKTPYLNPEIYSRISHPAVYNDKAAQRKQRETVKASIPLINAIVSLKEVDTDINKKVSPDTFQKLKSISPQLRRKGNVCSSLGRQFKQFSQSESSEQYLLDEPAIKRIRAEMKNNENNKQRS